MRKSDYSAYEVWKGMKKRCYNESFKSFCHYGGRGIKVCDRWMDFWAFLEDMGERPEGMSIDRIDVNGDYCKENCRWATQLEQSRNKTTTIYVELDGEVVKLADLAEKYGISNQTLNGRIFKSGMSVKEALEFDKGAKFDFNGQKVNATKKAREVGLKNGTFRARLRNGWNLDDAMNTPITQPEDTLKAKANELGLSYSCLMQRLKSGLSLEEALSKPSSRDNSLKSQAKAAGIAYSTVKNRLYKGMSLEEALSKTTRERKT